MLLDLRELDGTKVAMAGGKAANLGELCKIDGVNVPAGFCITTDAFKEFRATREIPHEITTQIATLIEEGISYAVRSSATSEDQPTTSFAGLHDTFLNVVGTGEILKHVIKCWDSLFTDRATSYRRQNNVDGHNVAMAVVVQKMVAPSVSGVLFTADPLTSNRKVTTIDATPGLGEALVSGRVNSDVYRVCGGKIEVERRTVETLTDEQVLELERLGRRIEAHFGGPQDIEWCLADGKFYIVQSRPITTLYPVPERDDNENHVYLSVGHQQMMTDAMKPLGLRLWQLTARAPMYKAGGRLFVDVTSQLSTLAGRAGLLHAMGQHDPLIKDALETIIGRDFIKLVTSGDQQAATNFSALPSIENDPAIVTELIHKWETSLEELKQKIPSKSGVALFDFISDDLQQFRSTILSHQNLQVVMAVINASVWLNEKMKEWLDETNVADVLTQSVPNNVTSEMGLALLDVADAMRSDPNQKNNRALNDFLDRYGMRCVGEIDITRPRWAEEPATLMPLIMSNIKNFQPGESKRRFDLGKRSALAKEKELLDRLKQLPDGDQKAEETKRMIDILRTFAGYREYPKYGIVSRLFVYKQALLKETERLGKKDDIYYLTFEELREAVNTGKIDHRLIGKRKEEQKFFDKLTPPRVITSDGEIISGKYKREDLPLHAIVGLAVSSGTIEGRARVILKMEDADFEDGDILVTRFTDPSWTPLFVSIKGLVTEVGGLMTHGAVIAREYGLPAVVGVENATTLIKDGQRIRVNGTDGYIEIL
jgi:phosphoenolpyruvate synthase/pyruvate phosphate dikinase